MKKIEKEFLKDFSKKIEANDSFENIKDEIGLSRFIKPKNTPSWRKWLLISVSCLIIFTIFGGGIYAISVEAKEYKKAVQFFSEHELSTNNLSRKDIKEIYKDIITESFVYSKTGEVIGKSISVRIPGYEIFQEDLTPEEISDWWELWTEIIYISRDTSDKTGIYYRFLSARSYTGGEVNVNLDEDSLLQKFDDQTLIWEKEIKGYIIAGLSIINESIIIYGDRPSYDDVFMASFDSDGNLLWHKDFNNGFEREESRHLIDNKDGTFGLISKADFKKLSILQIDYNGNLIQHNVNELGDFWITSLILYEDGYLIQLNMFQGFKNKIHKLSKEGELEESFVYQSEEEWYIITDMIEYNNQIYLSSYTIPIKDNTITKFSKRVEIQPILSYIFDNELFEITTHELTPMVKEQYTGMLLIIDKINGNPQEFYSVKGSLGGKLEINKKGELVWKTENINSTFFSGTTSSFTIGGISNVIEYIFDSEGNLIKEIVTGETEVYRR